ncbi:MAG: hypothetical protein IJE65_02580 [Clostridia bacterium]|nr:hypothetical protein [Clostridia bacterium]
MKKIVIGLILVLFVSVITLSAYAAGQPTITLQPQNPNNPEYSCVLYSVKADGSNLSATWYLEYNGKTYNTSKRIYGMQPWEVYAGETYGDSREKNTFYFAFDGIEKELDGAKLYCVIEDGHNEVKSDVVTICVVDESEAQPPEVSVPAAVTAKKGEATDIRCIAKASDGEQLTYHWYESSTGKLADIKAITDESEYSDFITCDTSKVGIRYYVCMVKTSSGGITYSSVIPVTVKADKNETSSTALQKDESKGASSEQDLAENISATEPTDSTQPIDSTQPTDLTKPTDSASSSGNSGISSTIVLMIVIICLLVAAIAIGIVAIITMRKK